MNNAKQLGILEEFRLEFQALWPRIPNKGLLFCLSTAWFLLFHWWGNSTFGYVRTPSLLAWMLNAYRANDWDEGHGVVVPFIVLGLMWWKRRELWDGLLTLWPPALGIVAGALGLHVVGYLIQQPRVSIVAMFLGLYGLMGFCWGSRFLRACWFPYVLLAFCIPLGSMAEWVTFPLRMLVTYLSVGLVQMLGFDVLREGSLIYDVQRSYRYDVAPACSGIRSLMSLLALTVIFGMTTFRTAWRRWVMVLAAVPLAVLGNVARITFTILVTELFGQSYGVSVEQRFGFVTFAVAIACLLLLEQWLREPQWAQPLGKTQSEAKT
ncbi:MAG: exosortase/archaeosortase family protein [Verrucomicrobiota bacterium]|nr:exosortase/archaeosortase family protein [Limisphaera sp.]MDW8382837.1 exosortase/archaeosortase family protein [Verrucomicrobiota bacterium]